MSRENDLIAALRNRLAKADTSFELSRCHFEAHALLRDFPGSVEGRLLLERIERALPDARDRAQFIRDTLRSLGTPTPAGP